MNGRLLDEPLDHRESRADRRVEGDHVEDAVGDRREAVALEGFRVGDAIRLQVLAGERDGALVDVNEGHLALWRELSGDNADHPVAAAEIEEAVGLPHFHVFDKQPRAAVNALARKDARLCHETDLEPAQFCSEDAPAAGGGGAL